MIDKAPWSSPCNGCGMCCEKALCPLGSVVFGLELSDAPCPALGRHDDGTSFCGLVETPRRFSPIRSAVFGEQAMSEAAMILVGTGVGCDAQAEDEFISAERIAARKKEWDRKFPRADVDNAARKWGLW